jgi:hypothetical protein
MWPTFQLSIFIWNRSKATLLLNAWQRGLVLDYFLLAIVSTSPGVTIR